MFFTLRKMVHDLRKPLSVYDRGDLNIEAKLNFAHANIQAAEKI